MPNRYTEILGESLATLDAGDGEARERLYRQARITLLRQFEADPELSIERRADELTLFETAVREIEERYQPPPPSPPSDDVRIPDPPPLEQPSPQFPVVEVLPASDGPPLDVKLEAEERLYGEPEEEEGRTAIPWVRLALLVIVAALGVWFSTPLLHQFDPPALYAGLVVNGLVLALVGAVLFLGSRRIWLGFLGAPLLFAGLVAAITYSPGLDFALEALFEPLSDQRRAVLGYQVPALSLLPGRRQPAETPLPQPQPEEHKPAELAASDTSPDPAGDPSASETSEPAPAAPEDEQDAQADEARESASESTQTASAENTEQAAPAPTKLARLESYQPLIGDWEIECDNGPGHRLTVAPPGTTGQTNGTQFARGRLSGQALAGRSKVAFNSPLAENEIEREVDLPAHPWPSNEWVFARETILLRAEYDGGGGEGAPVFSTFFMCPIKAENITAEEGADGKRYAINTECRWYVPRPEDLDPFFSGEVSAQCRFRRPKAE